MAIIKKDRGKIVRVDEKLVQQLKDISRKNEISFRQASREYADTFEKTFINKKITKEWKF